MTAPRPFFTRVRAAFQAAGQQLKQGTAVQFVGAPDWRQVISLIPGAVARDADRLSRATALTTSAYCWTAAMFRASRMSEPPLMVVRETADGEEWLPSHRLAGILDQPRPDVDMGELLMRTQLYRDLTSAALWVIDVNGLGEPAMLTPFSASEVKTDPLGPLLYGRYAVLTQNGTWRDVPRERVVHFRDVNPYSWREGVSRVDVVMQQLDLGHTLTRIVSRFLERAPFMGGVFSPDKEWRPTPREWDEWKDAIDEWYAGPANAGAPLALPGGTTYTKPSGGLADLLPDSVLDRVEATVGSVFNVPPVVLGWLTGLRNSPWSQMEQARRQAYEDGIEPIWRDVEKRLNRVMLTPEERAAGEMIRFDTHQVRALMDDEELKARVAVMNAQSWTVDELRVYTGQDPLEAGDPRGQIIPNLPSAAPAPGLGTGGPGTLAGKGDTPDLLWLLFDLEAKAAEGTWERAIAAFLGALRARVVKGARGWLRSQKDIKLQLAKAAPVDPESGASFQLWLTEILDQSRPQLAATTYALALSTGTQAVRKLAARLALSFDVLEPGLLRYASEESAFLANVMGETTGKAVAAAVQAGLEAGDTVGQLVTRLEELPEFGRERAKLTARTETTRAWNGAQRRSLSTFQRESGRRVVKGWLSARDERVRDEHREMDGEERGVDETFSNGLQQPGEPNCRCTCTYRVLEPDGSELELEEAP